jgi:hypothetical protein
MDGHESFSGIDLNTQRRLQEEKDGAARPGLRRAGGRIGHRTFAGVAWKTAEKFR